MEQYKYFDYQRTIPEPVPHIVVATKDNAPLDHPSSWCFDFATANAVKGQPACWGAYMDESVSVWSSDQSYFSSSSMPDVSMLACVCVCVERDKQTLRPLANTIC